MLKQYSVIHLSADNPTEHALLQIFGVYYEIIIQQQYLISDEEIDLIGVRMMGSKEADFIAGDRKTTTQANIANMAVLYDEGIPFTINEPQNMSWLAQQIERYLLLAVEKLNLHHLSEEYLEENEHIVRFYHDVIKLEQFYQSVKHALGRFYQPAVKTRGHSFGFNLRRSGFGFMVKQKAIEEAENKQLMIEKEVSFLSGLSSENKKALRPFTPRSYRQRT